MWLKLNGKTLTSSVFSKNNRKICLDGDISIKYQNYVVLLTHRRYLVKYFGFLCDVVDFNVLFVSLDRFLNDVHIVYLTVGIVIRDSKLFYNVLCFHILSWDPCVCCNLYPTDCSLCALPWYWNADEDWTAYSVLNFKQVLFTISFWLLIKKK